MYFLFGESFNGLLHLRIVILHDELGAIEFVQDAGDGFVVSLLLFDESAGWVDGRGLMGLQLGLAELYLDVVFHGGRAECLGLGLAPRVVELTLHL